MREKKNPPHVQQDLKENQMLSMQDRDNDKEDSDQKTEEEHQELHHHTCNERVTVGMYVYNI